MVYDATRVQVPLATDKEYFWVTPYEILVLYQYRNIAIDVSVTNFFKTISTSSGFVDKRFYHLQRVSDNKIVPSPYILFPCSPNTRGVLSTIKYENPIQLPEETVDLTITTIDHPQIGNFPLFSTLPLDPKIPKIQRYAVFVDVDDNSPTFIKEENPTLLNDLYGMDQIKQFTAISFFEKEIQFFAIKSPIYFIEIRDNILNEIPISSFSEISSEQLPESQKVESQYEEDSVKSNDVGDEVISNEGDEVSDDEYLEESEDGDEESNEGSVQEQKEEIIDEPEDDNYQRGYQQGLIAGLKEKASTDMS
jgi:hypothetical protein